MNRFIQWTCWTCISEVWFGLFYHEPHETMQTYKFWKNNLLELYIMNMVCSSKSTVLAVIDVWYRTYHVQENSPAFLALEWINFRVIWSISHWRIVMLQNLGYAESTGFGSCEHHANQFLADFEWCDAWLLSTSICNAQNNQSKFAKFQNISSGVLVD